MHGSQDDLLIHLIHGESTVAAVEANSDSATCVQSTILIASSYFLCMHNERFDREKLPLRGFRPDWFR